MKRLVIDTDPGVDDAEAIMIASAHPQTKIEAITVVAGNVSLEKCTVNACKIMEFLDEPAPIYAGARDALVEQVEGASHVHGSDGLGDCGFPAPKRIIEDEHGVNALVRLGNEHPGELTLVALGPLTNLALATRIDPDLPGKYKELIVMGGAYKAMGNSPVPTTEFNIYKDPEAAAVVFATWPSITLATWELTVDYPIENHLIDQLTAVSTPKSEFYKAITVKVRAFVKERWGEDYHFAADPLAMAVAIEPEIITESATHYVQVEYRGRASRGQTVVDWRGVTGKAPNTKIVTKIDFDRFFEMFMDAVR